MADNIISKRLRTYGIDANELIAALSADDPEPMADWERDLIRDAEDERITACLNLAYLLLTSDRENAQFHGMALYGALGHPVPKDLA